MLCLHIASTQAASSKSGKLHEDANSTGYNNEDAHIVFYATGPGQSARTAQHQSTSMSESDAEGFFSSGMRHQRALGDKKFAYKTVITHGKWKASPAMLRASVSDNMWNGATDGSVGKPWRER